ncbi:MAG: LCP family protein [Corynebacteriales bacterium]|nr:LCP family protein [Mycobacteriales bacterium]
MARHRDELGETSLRPAYKPKFEFRHAAPKKGKRKLRSPLWTKLCVFFGVVLILLSTSAYGAQRFLTERYEKNVHREDLLGSNRDAAATKIDGALNFLILGTDKRTKEDEDPNDESTRTWHSNNGERSDTIILLHIPEDQSRAYVISIPRDSYVSIPASDDGKYEGGKAKINAAFNYGGAALTVSTVNKLMGITINYPMIMKFKALREIVDAVGGVDVTIDEETTDPRTGRTWEPGPQHLTGKDAEDYARQRYGLPRGDYDRQARQQQVINAVSAKMQNQGILSSTSKLDKMLKTITGNLTVDESMPIADLVFSLKHLRPGNITYLTVPVAQSDVKINGESSEILDEDLMLEYGEAINDGTLEEFLNAHPNLRNDPSHGA